jgi:hypothetical protein
VMYTPLGYGFTIATASLSGAQCARMMETARRPQGLSKTKPLGYRRRQIQCR